MSEAFLHIPPEERSQIYRALGPELGCAPEVLEKDVWVCWVLQTLFDMPGRLPMAFKGGTSLSKVFGAIQRFSEDVDVTLDFRSLEGEVDPFAPAVSRNRLRKLGEDLKSKVRDHVRDVVRPGFEAAFVAEFGEVGADAVSIDGEDGDVLRVRYPSVFGAPAYLRESVLIEFGGRNTTEPNDEHVVRPDIAGRLLQLEFPCPRVTVLSPLRTFWEKATLIHVECQRVEIRSTAERLSRHWYDLAMLADLPIGKEAMERRDLLVAVVRLKKVFYHSGHARYDDCLERRLRLVPSATSQGILRKDFQAMREAGMFQVAPPSFDEILDKLRVLESSVNR